MLKEEDNYEENQEKGEADTEFVEDNPDPEVDPVHVIVSERHSTLKKIRVKTTVLVHLTI